MKLDTYMKRWFPRHRMNFCDVWQPIHLCLACAEWLPTLLKLSFLAASSHPSLQTQAALIVQKTNAFLKKSCAIPSQTVSTFVSGSLSFCLFLLFWLGGLLCNPLFLVAKLQKTDSATLMEMYFQQLDLQALKDPGQIQMMLQKCWLLLEIWAPCLAQRNGGWEIDLTLWFQINWYALAQLVERVSGCI